MNFWPLSCVVIETMNLGFLVVCAGFGSCKLCVGFCRFVMKFGPLIVFYLFMFYTEGSD